METSPASSPAGFGKAVAVAANSVMIAVTNFMLTRLVWNKFLELDLNTSHWYLACLTAELGTDHVPVVGL